jgi:hypothetical protein
MHVRSTFLLAMLLAAVAPRALVAQADTARTTPAADSGRMVGAIRAFIDCRGDTNQGCAPDFFILELPYVTWTRDRQFADVQLLVTTIRSGNNAFEYTITALGRGRFDGRADTSTVRPLPNEAEDRIRRRLSAAFALLLVPYVRTTPQASSLSVRFTPPEGAKQLSPGAVKDRWNFWVIDANANGYVQSEARVTFANLNSGLTARRLTERLGMRFGIRQGLSFNRFELDSNEVSRNTVRNGIAFARVVKATSSHWSVGGIANAGFNDFTNTALVARLAPVVEYNVFPWSEATRRQLAVSYGIGPRHFRWNDTTIFDKTSETRMQHELVIGTDVRQPWGNVRVSTRYASFVPEIKKWNLSSYIEADFNLVKGLSFNIGGSASIIRDQIFLSRSGQSDQQVLTRQRALATNYEYYGFGGFRYSFGSIYNSVVNPRLDFFNLGGNN